jgi:hypothetical protein
VLASFTRSTSFARATTTTFSAANPLTFPVTTNTDSVTYTLSSSTSQSSVSDVTIIQGGTTTIATTSNTSVTGSVSATSSEPPRNTAFTAAGGDSTYRLTAFGGGIRAANGPISVSVFGRAGARIGESEGVVFTADESFEQFNFARGGSATAAFTIFPTPAAGQTISSDTMTYRTEASGGTTTSSLVISLSGTPPVTTLRSRTGLVCGNFAEGETAVVRAWPGVYSAMINSEVQTASFSGNDTVIVGPNTSTATFWQSVHFVDWNSNFTSNFLVVPRNASTWPA